MERIARTHTLGDAERAKFMRGQRSLEVNPRHPLIRELKAQVRRRSGCWRAPCASWRLEGAAALWVLPPLPPPLLAACQPLPTAALPSCPAARGQPRVGRGQGPRAAAVPDLPARVGCAARNALCWRPALLRPPCASPARRPAPPANLSSCPPSCPTRLPAGRHEGLQRPRLQAAGEPQGAGITYNGRRRRRRRRTGHAPATPLRPRLLPPLTPSPSHPRPHPQAKDMKVDDLTVPKADQGAPGGSGGARLLQQGTESV